MIEVLERKMGHHCLHYRFLVKKECLNCFKNGFIETENEEHFFLRCLHPDLKVLRENLLLKACTVLPSFIYLNDTDKLVFLLSNCDIIFFSAKTCS